MSKIVCKTQEDYNHLCDKIWQYNHAYYIQNQPLITDYEYDQLLEDLEAIEKLHPSWLKKSSPTQRVGESLLGGFQVVSHEVSMLSLNNTYAYEEVELFMNRVKKISKKSSLEFCCEVKMDGIAISLIYQQGKLFRAITRGNGKVGDDVTQNVKTIRNLPLQLQEKKTSLMELRGEIFIEKKQFHYLNKQRQQQGADLWANPRNAAAGSLKLLDPQEVSNRHLSCILYNMVQGEPSWMHKQSQIFDYLKLLGLPALSKYKVITKLDEFIDFSNRILSLRDELPFEIDGIVIKVNDKSLHASLGNTHKSPRWAAAYKFAPEKTFSRIEDIQVQVGRTGTLTPVAVLKPVSLAGSTISRATLHNQEEIKRKDIRIGDSVIIEKGGDVIPKVVEVCKDKRPSHSVPWVFPTTCPKCKHPLVKLDNEVAIRCPNVQRCPEQVIRRLSFFVSKPAMNIECLGIRIITQLYSAGLLKSPADIYALKEEDLLPLEGFQEKSIRNILTYIQESKTPALHRFIMALGIKYVGISAAELVAQRASSIDKLMIISKAEMANIKGIGDRTATSIENYFKDPFFRAEVDALLKNGIKPISDQPQFKGTSPHSFHYKSFVLSGTLENYSRSEVEKLIKDRGGKVSQSISRKTDYLLLGKKPGSKLEKAMNLGVEILSEEVFIQTL